MGQSSVRSTVRLLYLFQPQTEDWKGSLGSVRMSDVAVWPVEESAPSAGYLDELMPAVASLLFGKERNAEIRSKAWGFEYRQSTPILNDHLRKLELWPHKDRTGKPEANFKLASDLRAEVWLSHQGLGILSLAFEIREEDLDALQQFVYWASKTRRGYSSKVRRQPDEYEGAPPPPDPSASVQERITQRGGEFTLSELAAFLLPGLLSVEAAGRPYHFTVSRFPSEVSFGEHLDPALEQKLFGIAQGEETSHSGFGPGASAPPSATFSYKHRVANATFGSTHFVADQEGLGFNEERVHRMQTKYFLLYLVSLIQRSFYQESLAEAAQFLAGRGDLNHLEEGAMAELSKHLFSMQLRVSQVTSTQLFAVASTRDVIQRYYTMCQKSNLVEESRKDAERSIFNMQGLIREAQSLATLRELAALNHIAHRFELVVLGVYAIEAAHILLEPVQSRHWLELGFFLAIGFAGVFLGLTLQRLRHRGWQHEQPALARIFGLIATIILIGGLVLLVVATSGGPR